MQQNAPSIRKLALAVFTLALAGCSLHHLAVDNIGSAIAGSGAAFAADDDPELIRAAAPFSLKLIESLLVERPGHAGLLLAAARGFTQYAYAFLQQDAEEIEERDLAEASRLEERARRLYRRARDHGLAGLALRRPDFVRQLRADPRGALAAIPLSDVPRVMAECGLLIGGVLLILGVALGFNNYLVDARIPERAVDWVTGAIDSRLMFLIALNLFLLAAGCLLDIFSATVVLVPLIVPLSMAFGIDPLHLGIIFLVNLELGYLTPPVGMNLFFAAYRFEQPLTEVFRAALPVVGVLAIGVLLVTFLPWLATGLPGLLRGQA